MIESPKNVSYYQSFLYQALQAAGIRQMAPGGKARFLADAFADQLAAQESRLFNLISQSLLPYAVGQNLDAIGALYGVYRIPASTASASAGDGVIRFYTLEENFGAINNGRDILIPAGTRITTLDGSGPVFVAEETLLPASENTYPVSAASVSPGAAANAAPGVLVRHDFRDYAMADSGALLVTNTAAILGGRDEEDDESYRFRIRLRLMNPSGVTEGALRAAVLPLPGVQDVVFVRKASALDCYVYTISIWPDPSVLRLVRETLENTVAFPVSVRVYSPDLVGISLSTRLRLSDSLSPAERVMAANRAVSAARNYIDNLMIGETLYVNRIGEVIRGADPGIIDVGSANRPIESIYIWRRSGNGVAYSRSLLDNYEPRIGERIVVEPTLADPIRLVTE